MESTLKNCKSCEAPLSGLFCSNCGQKVIEERYTLKKIFGDLIANIFNLEKGFFFTFKKLFTVPEEVIDGYLNGQTKKYYNPIRFFLIWISLQVLIMVSFNIWESQFDKVGEVYEKIGLIKTEADKLRMKKISAYTQNFLTVIPLFLVPFFSFMGYKLFSRKKLYFAEHCIINTYVVSMSTIIGFLAAICYAIFPPLISYSFFVGIVSFIFFYSFIYKRYFKSDAFESVLFALMTVIGGYLLFFAFCALFGIVVSLFMIAGILIYKKVTGG